MVKKYDPDSTYSHNVRRLARKYHRVKLVVQGKRKYENLISSASVKYLETESNRSNPGFNRDAKMCGFIAETGFKYVLKASQISYCEPYNYYGDTRQSYNNADYGDFLINREAYDVKASRIHMNVSTVYKRCDDWRFPIKYIIGGFVYNQKDINKCTIYYYGVLKHDLELFRTLNLKNLPKSYIIAPQEFKDFPFKVKRSIIVE